MQSGHLWDIFCTVIDNHGDLGVCWRLTRQLRDAGQRVRLWVDDASALSWMAPTAHQEPGIEVRPWSDASQISTLQALPPADVWVEAFGCDIPEAFVAHGVATRAQQPKWINLEYLSAEDWVPRMHGLPSPVMSGPAKGWTKAFFYPGFTLGTGGLLRETDLLERQQNFDLVKRSAWREQHAPNLAPNGLLISLFCYEPAALPQLLAQLVGTPHHLLVPPGRPLAAVQQALAGMAVQPNWSALPYTDQNGFDEMLWACDLNFVRGEDSLVRALWTGQPFVWHIYPQDDNAHHTKLEAFLVWMHAPQSLQRFHRVWNGLHEGELPAPDPQQLADWRACALRAKQALVNQQDLLQQLLMHTESATRAT
ncbi:elongation factor P maturation arginine rhamnosyltransferase EarP [Limnohabitans sp. 2KL-27]|uniref:elongation factor P maturation arginine rhamnosyltransferase EarP n=1 Tax=Limnohabitans sp. 2KL-27 TaxID=1100705 RepID=UPI000A6539DC|nr:elongation factor P maturation arginine rhamnosyltransferase EarP [Limnohabitans sp. 2KL-27]